MKSFSDIAKKLGAIGEGRGNAQPMPKWAPWLFWLALLVAFFLIAFVMPLLYWYNAGGVETQYYQYYTAFGKDAAGLESMAARYDSMRMSGMTFTAKAKAAGAYALKAKQVLETWNYTRSFILQSKGMLDGLGVDTAGALSSIESHAFAVNANTGRMASELEAFAGGDPKKEGEISSALEDLKGVNS